MAKYVAIETHQSIRLIEIDKAWFTPAGWHKPYSYYTLDNLGKAKRHPAQRRGTLVHVSGLTTYAKNARIVDDVTCQELDDINTQINDLKKRYWAIVRDRFRTFPLVQEGDLRMSQDEVFQTKQEAEKP